MDRAFAAVQWLQDGPLLAATFRRQLFIALFLAAEGPEAVADCPAIIEPAQVFAACAWLIDRLTQSNKITPALALSFANWLVLLPAFIVPLLRGGSGHRLPCFNWTAPRGAHFCQRDTSIRFDAEERKRFRGLSGVLKPLVNQMRSASSRYRLWL